MPIKIDVNDSQLLQLKGGMLDWGKSSSTCLFDPEAIWQAPNKKSPVDVVHACFGFPLVIVQAS